MSDGEYYFDLYDWRNAVASKQGPTSPSTKLALLVLSLHMNPQGVAWPSQATLAKRTGLGRATVQRSLDKAEADRWIIRTLHEQPGKRWRLTQYQGTVPAHIDLATKPWENDPQWQKGGLTVMPPAPHKSSRGLANNREKTAKVASLKAKVASLVSEGGLTVMPEVASPRGTNSSSELLKELFITEGTLARTSHKKNSSKKEEPEGAKPKRRGRRPGKKNVRQEESRADQVAALAARLKTLREGCPTCEVMDLARILRVDISEVIEAMEAAVDAS